jgi:hypothetical protein
VAARAVIPPGADSAGPCLYGYWAEIVLDTIGVGDGAIGQMTLRSEADVAALKGQK